MTDVADRGFLTGVFLLEAWDAVAALEAHGARLTTAPDAAATLEAMGVLAHRVRGSAALHGFTRAAELAAALEELVERARRGGPLPPPFLLDELVEALKRALDRIGRGGGDDEPAIAAALGRLAALEPDDALGRRLAEFDRFWAARADVVAYFGPEAAEHLEVMTEALLALTRTPEDEAALARLFRAVHTLKGAAYTVGCPLVGDVAHRVEDLLDAVRAGRRRLEGEALDAALAGLDALRALVDSAGRPVPGRRSAVERAWRLLERDPGAPGAAASPASAPGATAAPLPAAEPTAPARAGAARPAPAPARASVRVDLAHLDAMAGLVAELVLTRSRLERRAARLEQVGALLGASRARLRRLGRELQAPAAEAIPPAEARPWAAASPAGRGAPAALELAREGATTVLARVLAEVAADAREIETELGGLAGALRDELGRLQRLTAALGRQVARARTVSVERLVARLGRQAREAARAAGKAVVVETEGDTVELDAALVERLGDPLLQLVLNAVAHGIETPAERQAAGKPPQGTIRLAARPCGADVEVEVRDDGRGIDRARVAAEAVRRGLVDAAALDRLDDRAQLELVFLPGLSTAPAATLTAGRGVGLDVVRAAVADLGGAIALETAVGRGTRVTLRLPLPMAVTEALLVRAGGEVFALPAAALVGVRRLERPRSLEGPAREPVELDGRPVQLLDLARALGLDGAAPRAGGPVLLVAAGAQGLGLVVDEVLAREDVVIRRLGAFLDGVGPYRGATVVGDGRVVLVLDPERLAALDASPAPPAAPAPPAPRPRRVLLVDDSVSVRHVVGRMIERAGVRVLTATDGAEALERLAESPVDLVITDLEMPRVDGYELIRRLRRRPATRDTAVVVLTTRAGAHHAALAQELGVAHCLPKPVDERTMTRLLATLTAGER